VFHTLGKIAGKETVSLKKALEYINKLNWDLFRVNEIYDKLERNEKINLSAKQKKTISDWCISNLVNVDFKQSITKTDQKVSAKHTAIILWYFLRKFGFHYPKSTLLDMISFDWFEKSDLVGIEYLEMQLDFQDIKKRVLQAVPKPPRFHKFSHSHIIFRISFAF